MARRVVRRVGVETGGANIQFAVNPSNGRTVVIEMNPRVSRSSALASKATGFPIAKIAARLAVGLTLDEIRNDITRETPASFEPSLDYVVVKVPRFTFKKFPGTPDALDTQMRSVGEVMAIGRTFPEALQKALRSLEVGRAGLGADGRDRIEPGRLRERLLTPHPERLFWIRHALQRGWTVEEIHQVTRIDPWFLHQIRTLIEMERRVVQAPRPLAADLLREAKRFGFSDLQLAHLTATTEADISSRRHALEIRPVFKTVDTCAAEFAARTPYHYATYEEEDELSPSQRRKVMILGGGPNRIGQGIEFDYCCVHAAQALREEGFETILVNCNPETVSTDYDVSDRLYFEPLTAEDVLEIFFREQPEGVIVQFGGATPLSLALPLHRAGVHILGTSADAIDMAEDRGRFGRLLDELRIRRPEYGTVHDLAQARETARRIGYPVLVRPSYVLGGQAMAVCYDEERLAGYLETAAGVSEGRPILIDRFLEDAFEIDVDALADGADVTVCGIMQHLEEAGIHSGDSVAVLPTWKVKPVHLDAIRRQTRQLALALQVRGLMNVQFAIFEDELYVLEVNPRASRTVPFVSKACGVPFARVAARLMVGRTLRELGLTEERQPDFFAVKVPVFPFERFPGFDPVLGPEMRSTGEAYGADPEFGLAFAKGMMSAGLTLPVHGSVCLSLNDRDKQEAAAIAKDFADLGFSLLATRGTAEHLRRTGLAVRLVYKVNEGRPHIADLIYNGEVDILINTPLGGPSFYDEKALRRAAIERRLPMITTLSAARAAVEGIRLLQRNVLSVRTLQAAATKPRETRPPG
jgi:carbamoyl-phosphate synthase large subunit